MLPDLQDMEQRQMDRFGASCSRRSNRTGSNMFEDDTSAKMPINRSPPFNPKVSQEEELPEIGSLKLGKVLVV
ncbi:hypothetical protein RB195_010268 [Necator americanus]|uniref:Uncharacterized protein n=1 Tax=Necator americanus TaxID=51031 RepID=A0ABR1CX61_NECAM